MSLLLAVPNKYHNTMSSLRTYNGLDQMQRQNVSKAPFLCVDPESHTVYIRDDDQMLKSRIKQVMELTNKSSDEVAVALHDADNDINRAVNILLETSTETVPQNEWKITSSRKKKVNQSSENSDNSKIKTPDSTNQRSSKNSSSDLSKASIPKTKINANSRDEGTKSIKNNTTDLSSNQDLSKASTAHINGSVESLKNNLSNNAKMDNPKYPRRFYNERPKYLGKDEHQNTLAQCRNSKESLDDKNIQEPPLKAPARNVAPYRPSAKPFTKPPFARHAQFKNIPNKTDAPFNTNTGRPKSYTAPLNFRFNKFNGEMPTNQFGFKRSLPYKDDRIQSKSFLDNKNQQDAGSRRGSYNNRFSRGSYGPHRPGFRRGVPAEHRTTTSRSPAKSKPSKDVAAEGSEKWPADKMDSANWNESEIEKPFWNQDSFGEWAEVANKELSKQAEMCESVEDFTTPSPRSPKETNYNTISKSIDISELLGTSVTHTIKNVTSSYPMSATISESNRQASETIKNAIGVGIQSSPSPPKKALDHGRHGVEITEFGPNSTNKTYNTTASNIKSKLPPLSKIPTIPVVMPENNLPSPKQNYQFGSEFEFGSIEIQDVPSSFKESGHDSCMDYKDVTRSPKKPCIDQNQNREMYDTARIEQSQGGKMAGKDVPAPVSSHNKNSHDSRALNYKPNRNESSATSHRNYEASPAAPRYNNSNNGGPNRSNSFSRAPHHGNNNNNNFHHNQHQQQGGAYRPPHSYYGGTQVHDSKWRSTANSHHHNESESCGNKQPQTMLGNGNNDTGGEQQRHQGQKETVAQRGKAVLAQSPERQATSAAKASREENRDNPSPGSPIIITSTLPSSISPLSTSTQSANASLSTSSALYTTAAVSTTVPTAITGPSTHQSVFNTGSGGNGNFNGNGGSSSQKATPLLIASTISNVNRVPANFSPAFTPLLSHQYALGQALGLPYFPPPVYTFEDLQLLQRFPMAGFYDLSTQLSAAAAASALQQQQQHGMGNTNAPPPPNTNMHPNPNSNLVSSLLGAAQPNHHHPHAASFMGSPATLGSQQAQPGPGTQAAPLYPPSFLYGVNNSTLNQNSNNQQQHQQQQQLLMMNHLLPGMMNSLFVGTTPMANNGSGAPPSSSGKAQGEQAKQQQQQLTYHNELVMDSAALHKYTSAAAGPDKRRLAQAQQQNATGPAAENQDYLAAFQQAQQAAALVAAAQQAQQQQQPSGGGLPFVASTNPAAFAAGMGYYYPGGLIPGALPQYPLTAVFPSVGGVQSSNNVPVYQKNHVNAPGSYGGNYYTGGGGGANDSQAGISDPSVRTYQKQNMGMIPSGHAKPSTHHNSGMTGLGVGGGGGKQHSTLPPSNNNGSAGVVQQQQQQSRNAQNTSNGSNNNNNNSEDGGSGNSNCPKPQSGAGLVGGGDKSGGNSGTSGMVGLNAYDILAALQQQQQHQGTTSAPQHSDDNNGMLGVSCNDKQQHPQGGSDKYNNGRSGNHYVHGKLHGGSAGPQLGLNPNNAFGSSPPHGSNAMFAQQQQPQRSSLPAGCQYNSGGAGYHHQNMPSGAVAGGFQRLGVDALASNGGVMMSSKGPTNNNNHPYHHHPAHQQQTVTSYNVHQQHQANSAEAHNHAGYWN